MQWPIGQVLIFIGNSLKIYNLTTRKASGSCGHKLFRPLNELGFLLVVTNTKTDVDGRRSVVQNVLNDVVFFKADG